VLAAHRPSLHRALLAAKAAECSHINLDGTLIATDRVATPGPTPGVDLVRSENSVRARDLRNLKLDPILTRVELSGRLSRLSTCSVRLERSLHCA
jgi:hypothetical protein